MTPSTTIPPIVETVVDGKYRIESLIGKGAMGVVFRAEHIQLSKPVALKVLSGRQLPNGAARARFEREARTAGSLSHPNIVQYFDVGRLPDGSPFIVMELLDGEPLSALLEHRGGCLDLGATVAVVEALLQGLTVAHDAGIVHRDLKPENVFLATHAEAVKPVVKLLDFGVAKNVFSLDTSLTRTGEVVGTPAYMAPEQAQGRRNVDHRADIWAAGVLLYEMLTGALPFAAPTMPKLLFKIVTEMPRAPHELVGGVPPEVELVALTAMAKDPGARYQTAGAMLAGLRRAAAPELLVEATRPDARVVPDFDDLTQRDWFSATLPGVRA